MSSGRLVRCSQSSGECGVNTGTLRVGMGCTELRKVRGVEAPDASTPDFTGLIVPQASPSNVGGGGVELGNGGRS
jgi:hypothetical protein